LLDDGADLRKEPLPVVYNRAIPPYDSGDLDRNVVAIDQIRLIIRTFRDRMLKETFPDRNEVPKTSIFAKDDSHAEDILRLVLIQNFRNSLWHRRLRALTVLPGRPCPWCRESSI